MEFKPDPLLRVVAALVGLGEVKMTNARGEFACNSSSSHSIVLIEPDSLTQHGDGSGDEESFTLVSSTSKIRYLASMLNYSKPALAKELRAGLEEWSSMDSTTDSSDPEAPLDRFGNEIDEFLLDLAAVFSRPDVAIVGYSQGDDYYDELPDLVLPHGDHWRARKDTVGERSWWVLFNTLDGTKIRLDLEHGLEAAAKAPAPELVDVKLTDRCPFELDCGFCYMGSTREGVEATREDVEKVLTALSEAGVFEVAFGGGEPTLWPHFIEVLDFAHSVGVVPNFTTKNYKVLERHPELLARGAAAFSVNDSVSLQRFEKSLTAAALGWRANISVQVIPEICTESFLKEVAAFCARHQLRLTLLGYKRSGRGGDFEADSTLAPASAWIDVVKRHKDLRVAVDSTLAESCQGDLAARDVPEWMYHTSEGSFSMYVDAVTRKASASSYVEPDLMEPLDLDAPVEALTQEILEKFKRY
jgi:hypothetical protein